MTHEPISESYRVAQARLGHLHDSVLDKVFEIMSDPEGDDMTQEESDELITGFFGEEFLKDYDDYLEDKSAQANS